MIIDKSKGAHNSKFYEQLEADMQNAKNLYFYATFGLEINVLIHNSLKDEDEILWTDWDKSIVFDEWLDLLIQKKPKYVVVSSFEKLLNTEDFNTFLSFTYIGIELTKFILLSSVPLPSIMIPLVVNNKISVYNPAELQLSIEEIKEFFIRQNIYVSPINLISIEKEFYNTPLAIRLLAYRMQESNGYNKKVVDRTKEDLYNYFDMMHFKALPIRFQDMLYKLSYFEKLNYNLISEVLKIEISEAELFIQTLERSGNFICEQRKELEWAFYPFVQAFLQRFMNQFIAKKEMDQIYHNAIKHYVLHKEHQQALRFAELLNEYLVIRDLLEEILPSHVSTLNYLEYESYFDVLPERIIGASPKLIAAKAMLAAILCEQEEALVWYKKMEELAKTDKEAKRFLYYLFIAMPGHHTKGFLENLPKLGAGFASACFKEYDIVVTSNLPSALHGGRDFTNYVPKYKEMISIASKVIGAMLGKRQAGLLKLIDAEINYEMNKIAHALTSVTKGLSEAKRANNMELIFAGTCIKSNIYLVDGQRENVEQLWDDMNSFFHEYANRYIGMNMQAYLIWLQLLLEENPDVDAWMIKAAPNENYRFCTMDRYQYLTKARVYIYQQEYTKAYIVLQQLLEYARNYDMHYLQMECMLLISIVLYKDERDGYVEYAVEAVEMAKTCKVQRVISVEGIAILPILEVLGKRQQYVDDKFFQEVLTYTKRFAKLYPNYLNNNANRSVLTEMEYTVLQKLAMGNKNASIAEELYISENTVKYHLKNIYSKLEVKNRAQAVCVARGKGII